MKHILVISLLSIILNSSAQTIENVTFIQEGDRVIVYYDYIAEEGVI